MPDGIDARAAMDQAAQNDLVQRKIQMDALRARLGDGRDEKAKLRESCEGFEAIFLQKMWEQMRKNVSKEGYLHSNDEEAYQSLFDVELCKKMTAAGGIGLADMLYEQLSQKLDHAGRSTTPTGYRAPVPSPAASAAEVVKAEAGKTAQVGKDSVEKLTAENLYAEAGPEVLAGETPSEVSAKEPPGLIETALSELRTAVEHDDAKISNAATGVRPKTGSVALNSGQTAGQSDARSVEPEGPVAPAQVAAAEALLRHGPSAPATVSGVTAPARSMATDATPTAKADSGARTGSVVSPAAQADSAASPIYSADSANPTGRRGRKVDDPRSASWIGRGPVSAEPKPVPRSRRSAPGAVSAATPAAKAVLPTEGRIVGGFGWDKESDGQRRWSNGLDIAAAPGAPVRAVLPGAVAFVGEQRGIGSLVVLEHEGGLRSYYAGVDAAGLAQGQKIEAGANFAKVAVQPDSAAGAANSALLHFEIKRGEMALNPESVLGNISG